MYKKLVLIGCATGLTWACSASDAIDEVTSEVDDAVESVMGDPDMAQEVVVEVDIEDSTMVKDLDDDEESAICDAVTNAINNGVSPNDKCDVVGLLASVAAVDQGLDAVRMACSERVEMCRMGAAVGAAAMDQIPPIEAECGLFRGETSDCEVETQTLLECLTDLAVATAASVGALSCDTLSLEGLADSVSVQIDSSSLPMDSPVCLQVQMTCPGVFGGGGDGTEAADDATMPDETSEGAGGEATADESDAEAGGADAGGSAG